MLTALQTKDALAVLQKKYPNASSSLTSDNFVPVWCLADLYQQASFEHLKEGFNYIEKEVKNDRNATHNLIHAHASTFIASHSVCSIAACMLSLSPTRAHQAVTHVYDTMKRNRATRGGDLTSELRDLVDTSHGLASEIFDPMVERAHTAEKVRAPIDLQPLLTDVDKRTATHSAS